MSREMIKYFGQTDMGRMRTNNEDAFITEQLDSYSVIAAAIDGVGGYEGGEVASEIAKTEIPRYMREFRNGERMELLKQAVVSANNLIYEHELTDAQRPNMSCVLTAAVIDARLRVIDMVHVGDTRLYRFHNHQLTKLSHDHSLIGYREEIGDLTEEQAMHHPQRNVISRDVGSAQHDVNDRDFLEAVEFPLIANSTLLFCSDGLTDMITSKQIISVLEQNSSLKVKTQALIDLANEAGGHDNIPVVLVEYTADEPKPQTVVQQTVAQAQLYACKEERYRVLEKKPYPTWAIVLVAVCVTFALCMGAVFLIFRPKQPEVPSVPQKTEQTIVPNVLDTVPVPTVREFIDPEPDTIRL